MKRLTLKSLISQFLKSAELTLAPNTVLSYRHHLRHFLAKVKNKQVRSLRPIHLTETQRSWHDWQAVQRLMRWAIEEVGLFKKNPFAKVKAPGRNQRKRILTPRELVTFLRRARRAWRQFLLAMRELAARPQEIRSLEWDNLQSENPAISIDDALQTGRAVFVLHDWKDREKRRDQDAPRVLLVTARLGRLLLRMKSKLTLVEGPIFRNTRGKPWTRNAVRCMMRSLRRRLGFVPDKRGENVVAYTFRHSRATLAAANGILDRVLADWLGHVETRTTKRYQHLNVGHIRSAMQRLEPPKRDLAAKSSARSDTPKTVHERSRHNKQHPRIA